jgi:hypothetical protein
MHRRWRDVPASVRATAPSPEAVDSGALDA